MVTRDYQFNVGPQTGTLPTASTPTSDSDIVNKGYADTTYARRASWYESKQTAQNVRDIAAADRVNNQVVFCDDLGKFFYFDSASSAVDDGSTILTPSAGTGRWLQVAGAAPANQWAAVVSAIAVSGFSTHTTIQAAINAVSNDDEILILDGSYTETLTLNKRVKIRGQGYGTLFNGTFNLQSSSDFSVINAVRFGDNVTIDVNSDGIFITDCFINTGKTITDNGTANVIAVVEI